MTRDPSNKADLLHRMLHHQLYHGLLLRNFITQGSLWSCGREIRNGANNNIMILLKMLCYYPIKWHVIIPTCILLYEIPPFSITWNTNKIALKDKCARRRWFLVITHLMQNFCSKLNMTLYIGVELDVPEKLRLDRSRGLRYLGVDRDGGSGPGQICVFVNGVVCNIDMEHRRSCESNTRSKLEWNDKNFS